MAALATFDFRAQPSVLGRVCVVPLRLCASASNDTFIPLISLRFHEVKVRVKLVEKVAVVHSIESASLHVEYVYLDTAERKKVAQSSHRLRIHPKSSAEVLLRPTWNAAGSAQPGNAGIASGEYSATIELFPWLENQMVRDLIVEVVSYLPRGSQGLATGVGVSALSIEMCTSGAYTDLTKLDAAMASRVIPRHHYGIREFGTSKSRAGALFYVPFDSDPIAPLCTSAMMFRDNNARLRIWFEGPAAQRLDYDVRVHVTARTFNMLHTAAGMAGLKFFNETLNPAKNEKTIELATCPIIISKAPPPPVIKAAEPPFVLSYFLTPEESNELRAKILEAWHLRPPQKDGGGGTRDWYWLQEDAETLELLRKALGRRAAGAGPIFRVVGDRVTYGIAHGDKNGRLAPHADAPLQGGTHSLLVYLNDIPEGDGGRTRFFEGIKTTVSVRPVRGKGLVFGIGAVHDTEPLAQGRVKVVVACEISKCT